MPGNAGNSLLATGAHYYAANQVCHAGFIIAIDGNFTATIRQMDGVVGGVPTLSDHPGITYDNDLTTTATWHYPSACTNTT